MILTATMMATRSPSFRLAKLVAAEKKQLLGPGSRMKALSKPAPKLIDGPES